MTDREWRASHGICCWPPTPELCADCPCHEPREEAEMRAATTVSGNVSDPRCETIGVRKTAPDECANTPEGLTTNDAVGVAMAALNVTPSTPATGGGRVA